MNFTERQSYGFLIMKRYYFLIFFLAIVYSIKPGMSEELINYDRLEYNVKDQKEFTATITNIKEMDWKYGSGKTTGLYLYVKCLKKDYFVPVGPIWYFLDKGEFKKDLIIRITGIILKIDNQRIILPKSVKVNARATVLRNYDGRPFWIMAERSRDEMPVGGRGEGRDGRGGMPGKGGNRGMGRSN